LISVELIGEPFGFVKEKIPVFPGFTPVKREGRAGHVVLGIVLFKVDLMPNFINLLKVGNLS